LSSEADIEGSNSKAETMACRRCGVCCTRHQASVRPEEMQRIAAFLGITAKDWVKLYDDPRWEYDDFRLIRHINGACAFLKWDKGLAACAIHAVKPACCSEWQPGAEKKECQEGEKRVIQKEKESKNI
jgi:Fe-S-cluster containining protein